MAFGSKLKAISDRHDEMWSRISGGQTGLEQIIEYTVVGILTFLIFTNLGWIVKLQIAGWKREGERGQDELTREQIKEVKTRLMDLETEFQIMNIAEKKNGDEAPPPPKYEFTQQLNCNIMFARNVFKQFIIELATIQSMTSSIYV